MKSQTVSRNRHETETRHDSQAATILVGSVGYMPFQRTYEPKDDNPLDAACVLMEPRTAVNAQKDLKGVIRSHMKRTAQGKGGGKRQAWKDRKKKADA